MKNRTMLTEEERRDIEKEIHGGEKSALVVEVLKIIQKHRGWVPDNIDGLAEMLGVTPAELDAVATFYSLIYRRPVGRHVILVCDSVSCWIMGYEEILSRLKSRLGIGLGETSADGEFTLLPVACLGACDRAPALMIDETLYTDLTAETIDPILEQYRTSNG